MRKKIYIIGAGTYGEVMFELAKTLGYEVVGFYDEDNKKHNEIIMGIKVLGKFSSLGEADIKDKSFVVAIGNNEVRQKIMEKINYLCGRTPTLIHPKATISPSAKIGKGVYIQANACIWTKVKIGDFTIISPNVVICHHTSIGKACLISNISGIGASMEIGDGTFVGMGATIATGVKTIVDDTTIGAGAVVIKDIYMGGVYLGVPARKI